MSYYTGIKEIDDVLLDLYDEQVKLEEKLHKKPKDSSLTERHRKVVTLATRLLEIGRMLQTFDAQELKGTPDLS